MGPRSSYVEGKRAAETLFNIFHKQHNVNTKIVRIFNTYGPRMNDNDGRVVSNFIKRAMKNEQIRIYGSGNQTRSFMYVSDLIKGLILTMKSEEFGPINLGNPQEIDILRLADTIIFLCKSDSEIAYRPALTEDPQRRCPDISKARSKLNWQPEIDLHEGLIRTIKSKA